MEFDVVSKEGPLGISISGELYIFAGRIYSSVAVPFLHACFLFFLAFIDAVDDDDDCDDD